MRHQGAAITRRGFLAALPAAFLARRNVRAAAPQLSEAVLADMYARLLKVVNDERILAGLGRVEADALGSRVALAHAEDMARGKFLSHWGSDGLKPYHRYSMAGGIHAMAENVSSIDGYRYYDPEDLWLYLARAHVDMYNEKPPYDGHRQTILGPCFTHVGFGIAIDRDAVRLAEEFIAKYVEVSVVPRTVRRDQPILVTGRILDERCALEGADICYEPVPSPPDISWLRVPRPYGLPDEFESLYPKLAPGNRYTDGTVGTIETGPGGRFQIPVNPFRKAPGIYTLVVWLSKGKGRPFQATNICIRAE